MSSLIKSTAILAFARITNFALLFLGPVVLVRILDAHTFGQYREFMVYAMFVSTLAGFSVKSNLLYFIPHDPERAQSYINNTIWIVFCTTTLACIVLFFFREPLLAGASFEFFIPLIIYVLLFTNLDFLESYWIANKKPNSVFYFSVMRTVFRLSTVVGTAIYSPTVHALLKALIVVETIRVVAVFGIMHRLKLKLAFIDPQVLRRQLTFIVPIGLGASVYYLNQYIGQLAISTQLGVVALAIYTIGSYQVPILRIIRGSISDAIFPDMVREAAEDSGDNLRLWKRSNIAYTALIVPIFVVLFWYANVLIPFVFTDQYLDAVPLFRILATVMVIQCFDFLSPLRAVNRVKILLVSNLIALFINVGIILVFFQFLKPFAIYGPAFAVVIATVIQKIVLVVSMTQVYSITVGQLLKWRSLAIIFMSAAVSFVSLIIGEQINIPALVRIPVFSLIFAISYFLLIRRAKLEEVEIVLHTLSRRFRRT